MSTYESTSFRALLFSSLLGASPIVAADPTVMLDQGGKLGPRHDSVVSCYDATRRNVGANRGLVISRRITLEASGQSVKSVTLNGTIWEDGKRVPIQARCVSDDNGETVASVTRQDVQVIAKAPK
jgi:hypothetical protein